MLVLPLFSYFNHGSNAPIKCKLRRKLNNPKNFRNIQKGLKKNMQPPGFKGDTPCGKYYVYQHVNVEKHIYIHEQMM